MAGRESTLSPPRRRLAGGVVVEGAAADHAVRVHGGHDGVRAVGARVAIDGLTVGVLREPIHVPLPQIAREVGLAVLAVTLRRQQADVARRAGARQYAVVARLVVGVGAVDGGRARGVRPWIDALFTSARSGVV